MNYKKIIAFGVLLSVTILLSNTVPVSAVTGVTRTYDGGMILSVIQECTCSGGTLIETLSYVDKVPQAYVYQPGLTQLFANYYGIFVSGHYFLDTHFPVGICLLAEEDCAPSAITPSGTWLMVGSS